MTENRFQRLMTGEIEHGRLAVDRERLDAILGETAARVIHHLGERPFPKIALDFEHLQVGDYGAFEGVSDRQRQFIAQIHSQEPIRRDEMIFLALRSLFQLIWQEPQSEDELRYAIAYDQVLNRVLARTALDLAGQFRASDALLPYWGRVSFLRVMAELPSDNVERFGLDGVACMLLKRAKFNATTFALENGAVIGMNYALEPILKGLNRYLLHFFSTRHMAGPKRLIRAWEEIAQTVLHFWSDVVATRLARAGNIQFDERMAGFAHQLTADQLDFIVMHEIGHVALDHPARLTSEIALARDVTAMRHEFEFAADSFALGLMRSRLVKGIRVVSDRVLPDQPENLSSDKDSIDHVIGTVHGYQRGLGAAYLLFTYMDFIQRAGELLRERLRGRIAMREKMDTHPRASARLERLELMNLGEYLYTSQIERYARDFLESVLDYASGLSDEALLASISPLGT